MQHDPHIPDRLAAALRDLYGPPLAADPDRDRAILALASQGAVGAVGGRRSRRLRLARWGLAAAAGLALGVSVWLAARLRPSGDVNGDGRIDILDALVLSRRIDDGRTRRAWDLNHDGRVDRADVDLVALQAVSLWEKKS